VIRHQDFQSFEQAYNGFISDLTVWGYRDRIDIVETTTPKAILKNLRQKFKTIANGPISI
jgi:hypothetical protein